MCANDWRRSYECGLHIGVLPRVHYRCDGDAEVGRRAPEVCHARALLAIASLNSDSACGSS